VGPGRWLLSISRLAYFYIWIGKILGPIGCMIEPTFHLEKKQLVRCKAELGFDLSSRMNGGVDGAVISD